jgi:hypothetical protein
LLLRFIVIVFCLLVCSLVCSFSPPCCLRKRVFF